MDAERRRVREARAGLAAAATLLLLLLVTGGAAAQETEPQPEGEPAPQEQLTKVYQMYAENWKWTPDTIRVQQGTRVVLQFESYDAPHSFLLKKYGLDVKLPQDSRVEIDFVADKKGTFRWRCGRPCGDGCPKMTGKLIVE